MKKIVGFENYYITVFGDVYSTKRHKFLNPCHNTYGYLEVTLSKNNIPKTHCSIHKLVALAFIPNPNDFPQINHINGIKTDNFIKNLEWVTCKDNIKHSWKIGLSNSKHCQGEKHYKSKLTANDVFSIRELYNTSLYNQYELSKIFNISQSQISDIINKISWSHL